MIKRLIVIVTVFFTVITNAQEGTSSPYSYYGIGLTTFKGTIENRSMGGLGVYSDSIHLNLTNPAALGELRLTNYTIGLTHSEVSLKNETETESSSVTSLDYLAVGLPAGRWGFSFGLVPFTSVGYNLIDVNEEAGTAGRFSGRGGLNKVFLSTGYAISRNLNLGVGIDYGFGNIENRNIHIREGLQLGSRERNESRLSGFTYTVGLDYQQMLGNRLELQASAVYSPKTSLNSENRRDLATVSFTGDGREIVADIRNVDVEDSDLTMPSQYTLGAGIGRPRKWFLGMEYSAVEAHSFNNRSFTPEGAVYTDASNYRVGGFFLPNYSPTSGYFSRITYRAGARMEETGLQLSGEDIKEFGISFGVGLPAGSYFSNANLGFEYGKRGTTNEGLIQENFFNLSLSLSLNDRWFQRRKFN